MRRGTKLLFAGVDLRVDDGFKVGVIGRNGSGKSSLLALLRGDLHADTGELRIASGITIGEVSQETPSTSRPALEYAIDGDKRLREVETRIGEVERDGHGTHLAELHAELAVQDGYTAPARAARLLHGLGFSDADLARPQAEFSGGWRMRLNLAQALMCRSDLLLLDEPTNHLDLDAVLWLERWLQTYPGTLLLIAHDREFLDNVTDHVAHLDGRSIKLYRGDYSAFEERRASDLSRDQTLLEKQHRERKHIRSFVDRFRYKASKARQAQSRLKALERMERIAVAHVDAPFDFSFPAPEKLPDPLVQLEEVAAGYGELPVLRGLRLTLRAGMRIGLVGPNGAGKSTLVKLLAGELAPLEGERTASPGLGVGYFAQHQLDALDQSASPLLQLRRVTRDPREPRMKAYLGGFAFRGDRVDAATATFSGGEKARLALALLIWQAPNLLLLDEPTNHLDIEMRHALTIALQGYTGALVLVSHDRHLLRAVTDELWLIADGTVSTFAGNLDDYGKWATSDREADAIPAAVPERSAPERKTKRRDDAERRAERQPLVTRARRLERQLEQLTQARGHLDEQLTAPDLYHQENKETLREQLFERARVSEQIDSVEALWLDAQQTLDEYDGAGR